VERIDRIAKNMAGTTLCALGDFAANPIIYTIKHFPDDFKKHVEAAQEAKPARPAARRQPSAAAGD
jgi:NADH:ubiquinone oxidoreductase subunit F (NADH-binding)